MAYLPGKILDRGKCEFSLILCFVTELQVSALMNMSQ